MDNISGENNNFLSYFKRVSGLVLLLALSATFFYSAYTKSGIELNPNLVKTTQIEAKTYKHSFWITPVVFIENVFVETPQSANSFDGFQWTFLDLGINSMLATGIIARVFVGLELLLGLLLLFHIYLKKFTYPAVITILSIFIIYLVIVIIKQGNSGNCGCFGDKLAMKPLTAIWKNVIMIGITVLLMFIYPVKPYKYQEFYCLGLGLVAFSFPFLVNFVYTGTNPEPYNKPLDLAPLYKYNPAPAVELRTGKHIVAFMSLTCPHCKKAAYLLHIIHQQHPDIPIFIVLDGPEPFKNQFFEETHAGDLPNLYYAHHSMDFVTMAGPGVPSIFWVNNGVAEYKSVYAYYQLDPEYMEKWLKSPATVLLNK